MEQIQEKVGTRAQEILVMEDETSLAKGLRMILQKEGYHVDIASTGHGAMDALRKKEFDLLVADLRLPDMDGMDVIREVMEKRPSTKAIVITGYPSITSAVDAMKLGAQKRSNPGGRKSCSWRTNPAWHVVSRWSSQIRDTTWTWPIQESGLSGRWE